MADDIKSCRELDEQLAPYVDGEAPPAARRAIEAHMAGCPPCLDRAGDERSARDAVVEHRGELRAPAPPALRARCLALSASAKVSAGSASAKAMAGQARGGRSAMASTIMRRWAPLSLAATLVLAVAGVFVFGLNDRVEALAASLAVDHVKCFKVEGATAHADATVAARDWEHDQGWPIVVPQSEPAQQLTLLDVRRCFTTDGRSAHMMYTWRGAPLSLYVLPEDVGRDQVVDKMGHQAVIWCANRRTYAVVADGHPQDLSRVIAYMKAHAR
jgi:anti-sigma factor (TIGR02949 family)